MSGLSSNVCGQTVDLKKNAIAAFKNGNYPEAIDLMDKAKSINPGDPEVYYYLGMFLHYRAYDSRPLMGYDVSYTSKIFYNLRKAIELKPDYGDAYYFLGAQHGAIASDALEKGDTSEYKKCFNDAFKEKCFPAWLIEYDLNILKSCDKDAVLIVGGDAEYDPIQYLQQIENYRKDVTVVPYAFLERPWFVKIIRDGIPNVIAKAPISLSEDQIMDLHPFKWDTLNIKVPIPGFVKNEYKLPPDTFFEWKLEPDLTSQRGNYLSVARAVIANMIETNQWKRPLYFSLGCSPTFFGGLDEYFQLCGLVNKVLPFKTANTKFNIDHERVTEVLLDKDNVKNFNDVTLHDMPRVSRILGNYYGALYRLAESFKKNNQQEKIPSIINFVKQNLPNKSLPYSDAMVKELEELLKN